MPDSSAVAFPEAVGYSDPNRRKVSAAIAFPEAVGVSLNPPAKAGFMESLSGVPEELARFVTGSLNREMTGREVQRQAELMMKAEAGDLAAAKKLRSKGIAASTVASLLPMGKPVTGAGWLLARQLGRKAVLGGYGGAVAAGTEAAVMGEDIGPAAASGALLGGVIGGGVAGVGSLLARRAAERLAKAGKAATPEVALQLAANSGPEATTPVQRVLEALRKAPRLAGKQEALRTAERGVRIARLKDVATKTSGEAGFRSELRELSGEMPRMHFASLRQVVDQADVDALNEMVKRQPGFDVYDTIHAREGLADLFGEFGGVVPAEHKLKLLNKVFGEEFVSEVLKKRPMFRQLREKGIEVLGLSRSLMSTLDLSAPRQASFAIFSNPKQALGNLKYMFQHFASERSFRASQDEIMARPTYELMKRGKLELTDVGALLSEREEMFKSSLAERIPGIGKLIRGSNRSFTGYLNRVRADVFDDLVKNAQRSGRNVWRTDSPATSAIQRLKEVGEKAGPELEAEARKEAADLLFSRRAAHFVNAATGRGDLPDWLAKNANELTVTFFAPRYMSAHLTMLNPMTYIKQDPTVRKAAVRGLLGFSGTALGVLKLAELGGAEVDTDPTSPDWGKIKVGNTRYDILGGYQQYLRAGAKLLTQWGSGEGKAENLRQNAQTAVRFGRTKLSPLASFAADFYFGKDMQGKDVTFDLDLPLGEGHPLGPTGIVGTRFIPLILQDTYDVVQEWGPEGAPMAIPGVFGVGVQTYD